MLVLVTRPRQQALATAKVLHGLGYRVLIDPMLVLRHVPHDPPNTEGLGAVVVTSANAVLGIDERLKHLPVFAVGAATAQAARSAGCQDVRVAAGEGKELAELIRRTLPPSAGTLLHVCGEDVREGLARILEEAGYYYERLIVYRAEPAIRFSSRTLSAMRDRDLGAVLFYSPRTAETFAAMAERDDLVDQLDTVEAICLSRAVADEIADLPWREVKVAPRRDQAALLDLLPERSPDERAPRGYRTNGV